MLHRAGAQVLPDGRIEYDVAEIVGPYTWSLLHHAVETFPCEHCREEGSRLLHGLHDVVNADLGKPILFPQDLQFLARQVDQAMALLSGAKQGAKKQPAGNNKGVSQAEIERLAREVGFISPKVSHDELAQFPRCGTAKAAQFERCVQEVKAEGSADSPFGVCTASVGCSPS